MSGACGGARVYGCGGWSDWIYSTKVHNVSLASGRLANDQKAGEEASPMQTLVLYCCVSCSCRYQCRLLPAYDDQGEQDIPINHTPATFSHISCTGRIWSRSRLLTVIAAATSKRCRFRILSTVHVWSAILRLRVLQELQSSSLHVVQRIKRICRPVFPL